MKRWKGLLAAMLFLPLLGGCSEWLDGGESKEQDAVTYKDVKTSNGGAWYDAKATYSSYGVRNGGRQAWRIPAKGPSFGRQIKVVFSNGHTVFVKDTSHNYREGDGFVFKPGLGPNGEGDSNPGTAHGGVYLHAPYGNRSTVVTFFYKRRR